MDTPRQTTSLGSPRVPALVGDDWTCALSGEFCELDPGRQEALAREKSMGEAAQYQLAQAELAAASIVELIRVFEKSIQPSEEVRLMVIGGPGGTMIFPQSIMPVGADKLLFAGVDGEGCRVVTLQHISQFNVMLKAAKVEGEPRRASIGFAMPNPAD